MIAPEAFDSLFHQLASTWEAHQRLRLSDAPLADLAASSARLHQARLAMWDWRRCHTPS